MVTILKHQSIFNLSASIVRPTKCFLTPCRVIRCAQSASSSCCFTTFTNSKTKTFCRCSWLSQSSSNHSCSDLNSTIPYRPNNTYTEVCRSSSSHSLIYSHYYNVVEHGNGNGNFNLSLCQFEKLKGHHHCNNSLNCGNSKFRNNTKYSIYKSQISKKMPMFSPRILYHHDFLNNTLSTCQNLNISRAFSSGDGSTFDGSSDNDKNAQNTNNTKGEKLPRRVVKRLEKQGITEAEFLSKLKDDTAASSSQGPDKFTGKKEDLEELLKNMTTEPKYFTEADSFPSDMKRYKNWEKIEAAKSTVPKINPSLTSVVLFPGQGSQFVGMGKKLLPFPGVKDMYDEASSILGYDLLNLCLRGPKSELDKTIHCQPAVIITSLAAIEKFREEHPQAVENCVAAAGFSVGEFAALVFSGVLSFPDAVKLVKVRAEAMQKASERVGSGMLTVFLAHDSDLKLAIKTAKEYCEQRRGIEDPVCIVANYLFPECKVIAGHEEAIEFISTNAKQFNILKTKRLSVSGAFHTKLMDTAVQPLQNALTGMKIGRPKLTVYSNVTNLPYHANTNFSHMLAQQLIKPVRWEQIMHSIFSRNQGVEFPNTYEVGPGRQMGTLLKQVNMQAYKQYHNIEV